MHAATRPALLSDCCATPRQARLPPPGPPALCPQRRPSPSRPRGRGPARPPPSRGPAPRKPATEGECPTYRRKKGLRVYDHYHLREVHDASATHHTSRHTSTFPRPWPCRPWLGPKPHPPSRLAPYACDPDRCPGHHGRARPPPPARRLPLPLCRAQQHRRRRRRHGLRLCHRVAVRLRALRLFPCLFP